MSTVTVAELSTFMKVSLDEDQAQLFLDLVEGLAEGVVQPLPPSARAVILTAAARAIPNPSGTSSESMGGASASWGAGGVYLTRSERLALKRAGGLGGGAFSVNVAPDAGKGYRDPLRSPLDDREQFALDRDLP